MEYKKVSRDDVYSRLIGLSFDWMNPMGGAINLVNLASLLQTSRYQVKKHIDELKRLRYVELKSFLIQDEDEIYPPYWGYVLTEEGRETDVYKKRLEEHEKGWRKWVESFGE